MVNPQRRVQGVGFVVCRLLRFDDGACCSMHGVGDESSMALLSCRDRDASASIFSGHWLSRHTLTVDSFAEAHRF